VAASHCGDSDLAKLAIRSPHRVLPIPHIPLKNAESMGKIAVRFCLLDNYLQGTENIVWGVGVPFSAAQTFPFERRQVSV
jgi:hypothetical protein